MTPQWCAFETISVGGAKAMTRDFLLVLELSHLFCNIVGGVCAPILANVLLHELDTFMSTMKRRFDQGKKRKENPLFRRYSYQIRRLRGAWDSLKGKEEGKHELQRIQQEIRRVDQLRKQLPSGAPFDDEYKRLYFCRYADDVRHLTKDEILLAEKGGSEEQDLRVISPTWTRKPKGKGACEKRGKRVKTLKRCPARPA